MSTADRLRNAEVELIKAANRYTEAERCYSPSQSHPLGYYMDARRMAYVDAYDALKVAARELVEAERAVEDEPVAADGWVNGAGAWSPYSEAVRP